VIGFDVSATAREAAKGIGAVEALDPSNMDLATSRV